MRVLLPLLPGLGDALTAGPILDGVARAGGRVDVLAMLGPVAQYARELPVVDRVTVFDLNAGPLAALMAAVSLRRNRYDLAILPFPATRWQYHALTAVVRARRVATHDYGGAARALDMMQRALLVPLEGGHRIAENARLAKRAGFAGELRYVIPLDWRGKVQRGLLGVHTGTMRYKGNEERRWPIERFIKLIEKSVDSGHQVRIFIGPWDSEDEAALTGLRSSQSVEVIREDIASVARLLSECEVFVGNDAGVAHLAAALGVKTVTLFGMTDPIRAQPLGSSVAVRPSLCPPCHDEGMKTFRCVLHIGYRCTREDLTVESAWHAVERAFLDEPAVFMPHMSGPYRLYGRERESSLRG